MGVFARDIGKRARIVPTDEIASVLDLLALPIPTFVEAAYQQLLGRSPDPTEIQQRCGALRAGRGRLVFLTDLSMSAEFRDRCDGIRRGQSDGAFLEDVYQRYLGRQIDPQGMDVNLRFLARGRSRKHVMRQIAKSREARTKRTFWFELDALLADELAEKHWFWRWFGRYGRRERRRNRMVELTLRHAAMQGVRMGGVGKGVLRPGASSEAFDTLGANARRITARLRATARSA
jgi:hypothetical protein